MASLQAYTKGLGCSFVCFTYNDEHVPYSKDPFGNPVMTLRKQDFSDWIHKVRERIKYNYPHLKNYQHLSIGEYGDSFDRPHYHQLLFGIDCYTARNIFRDTWKYGIVDVGALRPGGIRYVVDYVTKQQTGKMAEVLYDQMNIERPFLVRSPGLGVDYFFDNFQFFDDFTYIRKGKRVPIPAEYRKKVDLLGKFEYNDWREQKRADDLGISRTFSDYISAVHNAKADVIKKRMRGIPTYDLDINTYLTAKTISPQRKLKQLIWDFSYRNNKPISQWSTDDMEYFVRRYNEVACTCGAKSITYNDLIPF